MSGSHTAVGGSDRDATPTASAEPTDREAVEQLGLDQVFETLKNRRRRLVLNYLREREGQAEVGDLSRAVAAVENDKPTEAVTSDERKRAYVGLYQCHLPKMDSMDVVEFEKSRGRVELGPNADALFPYIDPGEDTDDADRWHVVYGTIAAGSVVAFGLALVVATTTPWFVVPAFALVVVALSVTSLVHVRSKRPTIDRRS